MIEKEKSGRSQGPFLGLEEKQHILLPRSLHLRYHARRHSRAILLFLFVLALYGSIISIERLVTPKTLDTTDLSDRNIHGTSSVIPSTVLNSAKIGKITMCYGDDAMYARVVAGHHRHAEIQGYRHYILRERILHRLWSKSAYMLEILLTESAKPRSERLEWLYWYDADAILMNPLIPLETFLPPEPSFKHVHLVVTNDHNGLNSGGFFIRVSEWAIQYFVDAIAMPSYHPEVVLKYSEQSAMEILAKDDRYKNNTIFVPQRWFNAYRGPRDEDGNILAKSTVPENTFMPGDMSLHFAGKAINKLHMDTYMTWSEARNETFEIPLEKTSYVGEVASFWDKQRKLLSKKAR